MPVFIRSASNATYTVNEVDGQTISDIKVNFHYGLFEKNNVK